eukprot:jgi/Bigna1/66969/fgenesh1_pg.2_\
MGKEDENEAPINASILKIYWQFFIFNTNTDLLRRYSESLFHDSQAFQQNLAMSSSGNVPPRFEFCQTDIVSKSPPGFPAKPPLSETTRESTAEKKLRENALKRASSGNQRKGISDMPTGKVEFTTEKLLDGVNGAQKIRDSKNQAYVFKAIDNEQKDSDGKSELAPMREGLEFGQTVRNENFVPKTEIVIGKEKGAASQGKIGTIQKFIENDGPADDYGEAKFSVESVHQLGILDIRVCNLDRHFGNILVKKTLGESEYQLIPIDHGYSFPDFRKLKDVCFEWINWKAAQKPFSESTRKYIASLDAIEDATTVKKEAQLSQPSVITLILSTYLLQYCSKCGLTLQEIATLVQRYRTRYDADKNDSPSCLERLIASSQEQFRPGRNNDENQEQPGTNPEDLRWNRNLMELLKTYKNQLSTKLSNIVLEVLMEIMTIFAIQHQGDVENIQPTLTYTLDVVITCVNYCATRKLTLDAVALGYPHPIESSQKKKLETTLALVRDCSCVTTLHSYRKHLKDFPPPKVENKAKEGEPPRGEIGGFMSRLKLLLSIHTKLTLAQK